MQPAPETTNPSSASQQPQSNDKARDSRTKSSFAILLNSVEERIDQISVEVNGIYTVERYDEFRDFAKQAGIFECVAILLLNPIAVTALIIGLNIVPHNDPALGLEANMNVVYMDMIQVSVTAQIIVQQLVWLIPELEFTFLQRASIPVAFALLHTMAMFYLQGMLADMFGGNGFPIPFTINTCSMMIMQYIVAMLFFYMAGIRFKPNSWRLEVYLKKKVPNFKKRIWNYIILLCMQTFICLLYSAYGTIFIAVSSSYKPLVTLLLPITKALVKYVCTLTTEEFSPEVSPLVSVFTGELFNAIYVSIFLQQANGGIMTVISVMAFDLIQNFYYVHNMDCFATGKKTPPPTLSEVKRKESQRKSIKIEQRKSSAIEPKISTENNADAEKQSENNVDVISVIARRRGTKVADIKALSVDEILRLRTYHTAEHMALTEYIEIVVPFMYATYTTVMFFSPNRAYINGLRPDQMTLDQLLTSLVLLVLYSSLEFLSFLHLVHKTKKLLKINIFHQLAFVLKKEWFMSLIYFSNWFALVVSYQLEHQGFDFSFQFKWLYPQNNGTVPVNATRFL